MSLRSLASLVLASLLFAGCEKPFEPLAPNDLVFSIYGHLDAAADTQWVRVTPIRQSVETEPGPIDAVVTLEEIETGTTVVMSDSLSRYLSLNLEGAGLYAHNYSTTMPLVPGRHYRLTATRSDGAAASATVMIPVWQSPTLKTSRAFLFLTGSQLTLTYGTVQGTRHLGMVLGREDVPEPCTLPSPIHQEFLPVIKPAAFEGDGHEVQLDWGDLRPPYVPPRFTCHGVIDGISTQIPLGPKRVLAIAASEPWPYGATSQLRELSHTESINNIEGGVGFLAGVYTHVFPFDDCTPLDRTNNPCTITFDQRSAKLVGVVTNPCTGKPMLGRPVQLLGPPANGVRDEITDKSGVFQFPGLEPGASHSIAVQPPPALPGKFVPDFFPVEMENLVFAEAAVDTVRIMMPHRRNCLP